MQCCQSHKAEHADDQGIQQFSGDKATKDLIALPDRIQDHLCVPLVKKRIDDLFSLSHEGFGGTEHINGNDQSHQDIRQNCDHAYHTGCCQCHIRLDIQQHIFIQPF